MEASLQARRAIEALRAGVPNRDAVRALGFADDTLARLFDQRLKMLEQNLDPSVQPDGLLLAAEFGGGKSHALEYLRHQALERNFAVSKIVISKETQLFDSAKLFRAAIDSLEVEDRTGDVLADIAVTRLNSGSQRDRFDEFVLWLQTSGLNSRFAATMALFEHARANAEVQNRLVGFWAGGNLAVTTLKKDLRSCAMAGIFPLEKTTARQLARERFRFVARLLQAAGYVGWVLLLDELELVGRYSLLQRGRSYGELARLLGLDAEESIPGLVAVGAITPDYESEVLGRKDDLNQIGFRFRARGDFESELTAALAERAMDRMKDLIMLRKPDIAVLQAVLSRLAGIYEDAYGRAPRVEEAVYNSDWQMRKYVRSWINKWDLNRLYPDYEVETVISDIATDYDEE